ncbi:hypothetical protein GQ61_02185 [Candidatus Nucleicultrix amoebiphila FS5]|uniref:Uncharacterized protein n=1 Tax=Candidatus Nucleicultrix amoebiphila FS5 TaxID=1414854 RepID=A0A1W6N379_9PROT|nr:hypothetical protein GQ61_02185 [Candidatus Nucleicultrix amoebiphila FS5]
MGPKANYFDDFFFFIHLIDQATLNINTPRISTSQITCQFFIRGKIFKRIFLQKFKKILYLF